MEEEIRDVNPAVLLSKIRTILLFIAAWIDSWQKNQPTIIQDLERTESSLLPACRLCPPHNPLLPIYLGTCALHPPCFYRALCTTCFQPEPRYTGEDWRQHEEQRQAKTCAGKTHDWATPSEKEYTTAQARFIAACRTTNTWERFIRANPDAER